MVFNIIIFYHYQLVIIFNLGNSTIAEIDAGRALEYFK